MSFTGTSGILAQLGEHLPYKQRVTGSSPVGPIQLNNYGGIAQMARAHGSYPWCRGFESPSRYYTKDESVNRVKGLQAFLCCRHIHTKIYKISFYYCHNPQNPL